MRITRTDVLWNYVATFFKLATSILLIPLILREMSPETVGIWSVFMTISAFSSLLDFGFSSSFTRSVTYVFSGVKELKSKGFEEIKLEEHNKYINIDYSLLKGLIGAMRWFYLRISILLFLVLITIGTYYISKLTLKYSGNQHEIYIAWFLLCLINCYNLYTLYYESLLTGRGLIKRSKQIIILGQITYLCIAATLIIMGKGLIAIIAAQAVSVVIIRILSFKSFFNKDIRDKLQKLSSRDYKKILSTIYPNAIKEGMTSFGGFMVQKSSIIIGSIFLSLQDIASYGISMQVINVISGLSMVYMVTYQPKIAHLRTIGDYYSIQKIYVKGQLISFITYILFGIFMFLFGEITLAKIGSLTQLIGPSFLMLALIISFIETNITVAGIILLTKNEVPFYKASLISGSIIILGLIISFNLYPPNLYLLFVVPLIVDIAYQGWKWPFEVFKDLRIKFYIPSIFLRNE